MDPPVAAEVETKPEKTDETKGSGKSYDCGLCDTEIVYKIAQELLPGLASACVDNTTGGIFKSAGSIAVDMRKEMVDYLTQRSETYVAEFLLAENASGEEVSEHPYDIIISLIDDFAASKRNMFSRVSEWVLSDRRDDRIDDFVQEMEINGFWLLARRECVASTLLKNVDYKNVFHCNMVCSSEEEVAKHRSECKFRPMDCTNEGCTTRYCAAQKEHHEAICPFMILPCEQKCSDFVMRREMDRHCVTICPMKLVNCAFYTVGCESGIPRCNVQQHNSENLSSHLLYILRTAHKEASHVDLKHRVEQIRSLANTEKLARARDARALTYLIKDAEAKLGPLEVKTKPHADESKEINTIKEAESPSREDSNKKESPTKTKPLSTGQPAAIKDGSDSPNKKEEQPVSQPPNESASSTKKPAITEDDTKLPTKEEVHPESPKPVESAIMKEGSSDSPVKVEESREKEGSSSTIEEDEHDESPMKKVSRDLPEEESKELAAKEEEQRESPMKGTLEEPSHSEEEETTKSPKGETVEEESSNTVEEESTKSSKKETISVSSSSDEEESKKSPKKDSKQSSSSDEEDSKKSPKNETVKKELSRGYEEDLNNSPKKETVQESSRGDEEDSTNSPKKETVQESPRGDEEESTRSPKREKTKVSSGSDEESTKSPSHAEG